MLSRQTSLLLLLLLLGLLLLLLFLYLQCLYQTLLRI
jgi:hypothetical protein